MSLILFAFPREKLPLGAVPRCIIILENDLIITKPIFSEKNEKINQCIYVRWLLKEWLLSPLIL